MNLIKADPPVGKRGKYFFGNRFSEGYNPFEIFYLKYSLIHFVFDEEKVSQDIVFKFDGLSKKYLQHLSMTFDQQEKKFSSETLSTELENRMLKYTKFIEKAFKTKSVTNKMEININLYKYAYKNMFSLKFDSMNDVEIEEWLNRNINDLDIIRTFILWFYEAIHIIMSPYDTLYFEE
jgi:hypothetical protein